MIRKNRMSTVVFAAAIFSAAMLTTAALAGCGDNVGETENCEIVGETPAFLNALGCDSDFAELASEPLVSTIPGARSLKTVLDQADGDALYFQNSKTYKIHHDFASAHLSGDGLPFVGSLEQFNTTEYYSPDRRFVLGALTRYEGPKLWVFEISPYDTATADMVTRAYRAISSSSFIGDQLAFHPTSENVERILPELPADIKIVTTDEIFAGIDYQPLNLAETYGRLRFMQAATLDEEYPSFRDLVVLDKVPNDISVVAGLITEEFQTPLSHVNVLSQNRRTPNMGLRGATTYPALKELENKWVRLKVGALDWTIEEVTQEEADAWWEDHKPGAIQIPDLDLSRDQITDIEDVLDTSLGQKAAIKKAIPAFGGKASHYAELARVEGVPVPTAFAIPIFFYDQFMKENGFDTQVASMLEDTEFQGNPMYRDQKLKDLRNAMRAAPLNADFLAALTTKLQTDFPDIRMRFRSSTNAEDLDGFTGAGLYTSKSGDLNDPDRPIEDAVRKVWASVWFFRAFEERSFRSISHLKVGMSLLVHRSFPDEYANGVAITANIYDPSGANPAFYINVQRGGKSVVKPEAGVRTDEILYQYYNDGQPAQYLGHSTEVPAGENVLTSAQLFKLGQALDAIHRHFAESYGGDPTVFYGMDVEFKFDDLVPGGEVELQVKQARPHPGRGQ